MTDPKKARCYDPSWRYTRSEATDVAKTFARAKRQMKEQQPSTHVVQLRQKKGA